MINQRLFESAAGVIATINIRPHSILEVGEGDMVTAEDFTMHEDAGLIELTTIVGNLIIDEVSGNNSFRIDAEITDSATAKLVYDWLYSNTNITRDEDIETYVAPGLIDLMNSGTTFDEDEIDYEELANEIDRDNIMKESMRTRQNKYTILREEEELDIENAPDIEANVEDYDDVLGYAKFNISPEESENLPSIKRGQVAIIYAPNEEMVSDVDEELDRVNEAIGSIATVSVVGDTHDTDAIAGWIEEAGLATFDTIPAIMVVVNQDDIAETADFFENEEFFSVDPIIAIYDGKAIYTSLAIFGNDVAAPSEILAEIFGDLDVDGDVADERDNSSDEDIDAVFADEEFDIEPEEEMYNESVSSRFAKYRKLYESALLENDDETLNEKGDDEEDTPTEADFADIFGDDSDTGDEASDDNTEGDDEKEPDNGEESDDAEDDEDVPMTAVLLTVKKDDADKCKDELIDAGIPEEDIEILDGEEDDEDTKIKVDANSVKELKDYLSGKGIDLEEKIGGEIIDDDEDSSDEEKSDDSEGDEGDNKEKSNSDEEDALADMDFGDLFGDDEESAD